MNLASFTLVTLLSWFRFSADRSSLPENLAVVTTLTQTYKEDLRTLYPEQGPNFTSVDWIALWAWHLKDNPEIFTLIQSILEQCGVLIQCGSQFTEVFSGLHEHIFLWFVQSFPTCFCGPILLVVLTYETLRFRSLTDDSKGIVTSLVDVFTNSDPITWYGTMLGAGVKLNPTSHLAAFMAAKIWMAIFIDQCIPSLQCRLTADWKSYLAILLQCSRFTLEQVVAAFGSCYVLGPDIASRMNEVLDYLLPKVPQTSGLQGHVVYRICSAVWSARVESTTREPNTVDERLGNVASPTDSQVVDLTERNPPLPNSSTRKPRKGSGTQQMPSPYAYLADVDGKVSYGTPYTGASVLTKRKPDNCDEGLHNATSPTEKKHNVGSHVVDPTERSPSLPVSIPPKSRKRSGKRIPSPGATLARLAKNVLSGYDTVSAEFPNGTNNNDHPFADFTGSHDSPNGGRPTKRSRVSGEQSNLESPPESFPPAKTHTINEQSVYDDERVVVAALYSLCNNNTTGSGSSCTSIGSRSNSGSSASNISASSSTSTSGSM